MKFKGQLGSNFEQVRVGSLGGKVKPPTQAVFPAFRGLMKAHAPSTSQSEKVEVFNSTPVEPECLPGF